MTELSNTPSNGEVEASDYEKTSMPRDIRLSSRAQKKYNEWTESGSGTLFEGRKMSKVFMVALTLGYHHDEKVEFTGGQGSIPRDVLTEEEIWVVRSIAVAHEQNLDVLNNGERIHEIVIAYAEGGLDYLEKQIEGSGMAVRNLGKIVLNEYEDTYLKEKADADE